MTDIERATKFQMISSPIPVLVGETKEWKGTIFKMTSKTKSKSQFKIQFEWQETKNGIIPYSMHIESMNKQAINADIIREIKVGQLLRDDIKIQRNNLQQADGMIDFINQNRSKGLDETVRLTPSINKVKKISGKRSTTEQHRLVAELWKELATLPTHESPGKYIGKRLGINYSTARTRIKQCRELGLIPNSTHGNAKIKPKRTKAKPPT
jgi:hypothetical protein